LKGEKVLFVEEGEWEKIYGELGGGRKVSAGSESRRSSLVTMRNLAIIVVKKGRKGGERLPLCWMRRKKDA